MNTEISANDFYALASVSGKRFSVEAFSFTHQFGLNINFEDYEEFKEICKGIELEFWALHDTISDAEIQVSQFASLKLVSDMLLELDSDKYELIEQYALLVNGNFTTWSEVENYHDNNFVTDFVNNEDFGTFLIEEVGCLEIPEELQNYFDYREYGKDALQNSYDLVGKKVYHQS